MKNLFFHNFNTAIIRFAFFGLDGCLVCVEIDVERHKALLVQSGKHVSGRHLLGHCPVCGS